MWLRRFRELRVCLQNLALGNPYTIRQGDTHLHLFCRRPLPHSLACVCLLTRRLTPLLAWGTSSLLLARIFGHLSVFSHGGSGPRQGHDAWEVLGAGKKGHARQHVSKGRFGLLAVSLCKAFPLDNPVYTRLIHTSISISVSIYLSVFLSLLSVHLYLSICVRTSTHTPLHKKVFSYPFIPSRRLITMLAH